jgi:hypothetical protein
MESGFNIEPVQTESGSGFTCDMPQAQVCGFNIETA